MKAASCSAATAPVWVITGPCVPIAASRGEPCCWTRGTSDWAVQAAALQLVSELPWSSEASKPRGNKMTTEEVASPRDFPASSPQKELANSYEKDLAVFPATPTAVHLVSSVSTI